MENQNQPPIQPQPAAQPTHQLIQQPVEPKKGFLKKLTFVIGFLILVILFSAGLLFGKNIFLPSSTINHQITNIKITPTPIPTSSTIQISAQKECKQYKYFDKPDLYETYTVKPGDSLLSISNRKYGSPNRIGDIIELNKDNYPTLNNSTFLEVGWKLYIPSINQSITLGGVSGNITKITKDYFGVQDGKSYGATFNIYYSRVPKYKDNFTYKIGDCVTVIYEGSSQIPLSIELQK